MNESPANDSESRRERELIEEALEEAFNGGQTPPTADPTDSDTPGSAQPPPDSFTGYELVGEIHRGGQGVVYQALQKATRRKVAIKALREGPFAGPRDKARFEQEVQILGQLKHPNIVAIHHSGEAAGHHFFVMDYIAGQPLDVFMASEVRSIDDTLRLFAKICEAINAAHLRGAIHRDLKPSNIRIDENDEPHILDFGLAKVTAEHLTDESKPRAVTVTGQFLGSLPWASPEQAAGSSANVDVRTDVYSLGVILYQMLTGRFPYDVVGNMRDVLNNILTADPARPSTLRRQVNDEVETIVLKCLSKERERRYQTAGELARDVGHYLAGEPIAAKRDSGWYVLRKTLRRHRLPVTATAVILVVLAASAITLSVMRSGQQRLQQQAETISSFLESILSAVDPRVAKGHDVTVLREVLDQAANSIDREFEDQPLTAARLRHTIGNTYVALGLYDDAEPHLTRAVELRSRLIGEESPETLLSLMSLTALLNKQGRYEDAERLTRQALDIRRRVLGEYDPDTMAAATALASIYESQGRYDEAESLFLETLENQRQALGESDPATLRTLTGLAVLYEQSGRLDEAERMHIKVLEIKRRALGEEDLETLVSVNNLGLVYLGQGRLEEAERMFQQTLDVQRRVLGPNHQDTVGTMTNLGGTYIRWGRYDEAERSYLDVLRVQRDTLGDSHPDTLSSMGNLGGLYVVQGRYGEAEPLLVEAMESQPGVLGGTHPDTLRTTTNLGQLYSELGRYAEAEPLMSRTLALHRSTLGAEHPDTLIAMGNLGELYVKQERYTEARPLLAEAVDGAQRTLTTEHWLTGILLSMYGQCLTGLGEFDEAEKSLMKARDVLETAFGPDNEWTAGTIESIVVLYESWGKPVRAAEFRSLLPPVPQEPVASD
jgi:serine/threonine protein kinase/Tfp pilus assembly protein PilF